MEALAPSYQFRADTVTLSAGNVATIPNRRGADALVLAAGTLAAPAPDALFGARESLTFTGSQWLDSNLAPSAWKFLHDGTGCEEFTVFLAPSVAATQTLWATRDNATSIGRSTKVVAGGQVGVRVTTTSGTAVVSSNAAGSISAGAACYINHAFSATAPIRFTGLVNAAVGLAAATSTTPNAGDPQGTFRLGADRGATEPANMRWCETLIFPRVLHEYERQIVREYIAARYAIAAPSLTGADRDIMSLLPFSWFDAAAYNTSGGKVTAFLDRARPGHTFAQATGANQVLNPTADATLAGALSATFNNTEFYGSSLPASAWRFFHGDGNGMETYDALVFTDIANAHLVRGTYGVPGSQAQGGASGQVAAAVYNAGGNIGNGSIPAVLTNGAAVRLRTRITATQIAIKSSGVNEATSTLTGVPLAGDPGGPLRLGGRPTSDATVRLTGRYAGMVSFDRQLVASERAKIDAAMLTKYGVAA